jgi:hypothetical protein
MTRWHPKFKEGPFLGEVGRAVHLLFSDRNDQVTESAKELTHPKRLNQLAALQPDEVEVGRQLWRDLRDGVPNAPKRLKELPEPVRDVVLEALVAAIDNRRTELNLLD